MMEMIRMFARTRTDLLPDNPEDGKGIPSMMIVEVEEDHESGEFTVTWYSEDNEIVTMFASSEELDFEYQFQAMMN
jgi:hypothetical protein